MQRRVCVAVLPRMRTKLDLDCVTVINMGETASALKVAGSDNGGIGNGR
jgi:hypothetical protein